MSPAFGDALHFAQNGEKHDAARPLKGFGGAGVLEVVENDEGGTCFRKKSKSGIATPKEDRAVIETRLKAAVERLKEIRDGKATR